MKPSDGSVIDSETSAPVASTLQRGTKPMVITDFAAGPETRTGPDFTVIVADTARTKGSRRSPTIGEVKTIIRTITYQQHGAEAC